MLVSFNEQAGGLVIRSHIEEGRIDGGASVKRERAARMEAAARRDARWVRGLAARPDRRIDRMERTLGWFDRHLKHAPDRAS